MTTTHETLEQGAYAALVWELLADQVDYDDLKRLYASSERVEGTIAAMRDAGALPQDTADQVMRDEH